ncbi:MAG: DUF2807 domain-containing protein [Flavobacteriales bacterium]|jgi:hypothetical protein|nr:DUF2807 domain-containing protein [Flavobacteriales bacterium]
MITKTTNLAYLIVLGLFTQFNSNAQIFGDGNIISQSISTSTIEHLEIHPSVTSLIINEGSTQNISLSGDSNIVNALLNSTSVDSLSLKFPAGNTYSNYTLNINITTQNIESIRSFGSGEVTINNFTNTTSLDINNLGAANYNVYEYTNASSLHITNNGSGDITMNENFPSLTNYEVYNHGGGNYNGCGLETDSVLVQNFGSGDMNVGSTGYVNAIIFGSGNIYYYGTPSLYQNNFGIGSISLGTSTNCISGNSSGNGGNSSISCINGDGSSATSTTSLSVFEHIKILPSVQSITIQQGTTSEILATGNQNIIDSLEYTITNDTLFIHFTGDSCYDNYDLNLTVTTSDIKNFIMMDSGNATIEVFDNSYSIEVFNYGAGNISVNEFSDAYFFKAHNYGSGDITVNEDFSFVSSYTVNNYGSGNYYGCQLNVASCYANNFGSGNVVVTASGYLNAELTGTGNIEYYETPTTIDQTITGTGILVIGTDPDCVVGNPIPTNITGDGNIISQSISTSIIEHLDIDLEFTNLTVNEGSTQSIVISGDSNIVTSLINSTLVDTFRSNFPTGFMYSNYTLNITITTPSIKSITTHNNGEVLVNDFSSTQLLNINNLGNANYNVYAFVGATDLYINNHADGDINMNANFPALTNYEVYNHGGGSFYGCGLETDSVLVQNFGSGDMYVASTNYVNAAIFGSGDIYYYGSPDLYQNTFGSGSITLGSGTNCTTGGTTFSDCIQGDGTTTSHNFNLGSFDYINLDPAVTSISLVQGTTPGVTVSGDNNIVDSLQVEVINDTLYITFPTDTCFENYALDLNITATGFVQFAMRNEGNSTISGFDGEENIEIINYGSGNITVESFQDVTNFLIENYGSGDISIDGDFPNLDSYEVNNYNSGNIYGCELTVDSCFANNHSEGTIVVSVEKYLKATIQSAGNIEYYGSPIVDETLNGTGSVNMGTEESCIAALDVFEHESNGITFVIYPNPSKDIINLSGQLEQGGFIFNTFGQKVMSISENQNQIDVRGLNFGNYIVKIGHQTAKFIKTE